MDRKMKRVKIISTIILLLLASSIYAQKSNGITFTVNATGTVNMLTDNINVTMNLGVENTDPQKAFDEHKLSEQLIIKLIKKYGISDKDISYTLFNISKYQDYKNKTVLFKTNQKLQFILKDFSKYTPLQIDLLKNGFNKFRSNFLTTKSKEGHKISVKEALQNAKAEAELYASNLNLKVGEIVSITSNNPVISPRSNLMLKAEILPQNYLINITQYIPITTNVRVVYKFVE